MHALIRCAFHLSRLRSLGSVRVAAVVDSDLGVRADDFVSLLRPWRSWLEVTEVVMLSDPLSPPGSISEATGADALAVVTERPEFFAAAQAASPIDRVVHSDFRTHSEREMAFLQETAHHYYELGGINEWDGAEVRHSATVLQHLSATHCVTHFPVYMTQQLRSRHAALQRPLEALDVGSGSISRLRWGALEGLLTITGVDPLVDIYDIVVARHGLDGLPAIRVKRAIAANAEDLDLHVTPCSFDFAYCCNALDHVEDPPSVVVQIGRALRAGGWLALEFATREGTRQGWEQLHKFDLYLDEQHHTLACRSADGEIRALVPASSRLTLSSVVYVTDDYTAVVLERAPDIVNSA